MAAQNLQFVSFSEQDLRKVAPLPRLGDADQVEVRVRTKAGQERTIALPHAAVSLIGAIFESLARGERVAVLSEERELSPNDAAEILGISRPLVVHRMDIGDLPFRYVGKHRRARLIDVIALKARLEEQRSALKALAQDTEELARDYGV